jgi:hypothetical protein
MGGGISRVGIVKGVFDAIIAARKRGVSIPVIADTLTQTTGIKFSHQYLRNMLSRLGKSRES